MTLFMVFSAVVTQRAALQLYFSSRSNEFQINSVGEYW
ncbi:hypothetical protein J502_0181 [Acinetobacter sp. 1294596]|nr:hypothetical protein J502_0181 [Acinetobacter sp. 1294596]